MELDELIRESLTAFAADLGDRWTGRREREAVSLFAFGYLLPRVRPDGFLRDPTQIGIEVPVPQLPADASERRKNQVCKDLVLWPEPRMTCWGPEGTASVAPRAILEWKFNEPAVHPPDVQWLTAFSARYPGFVGYAVTADQQERNFRLSCTRVTGGKAESDWLVCPTTTEMMIQAIRETVGAAPGWCVVGTTRTLVRAIPLELEKALPAIGEATSTPSTAWLTLHFWVENPPGRLGVFWRASRTSSWEIRDKTLDALVRKESKTGFFHRQKDWRDGATPAFAGRTVSDDWWPQGSTPDLEAVRNEVRTQLAAWSEYVPAMIDAIGN
jgi:hypothetical protein